MKADEIIEGITYRVKIGVRQLHLRVDKIVVTQNMRIQHGQSINVPTYSFECTEPKTGKVYIIKSLGQFMDEVIPPPEPEDHVQIVKGIDKDSLTAKTTYRVFRIEHDYKADGTQIQYAVLISGKKTLRVAIDRLRVVSSVRSESEKGRGHKIDRIVAKSPGDKKEKEELRKNLQLMSDDAVDRVYEEVVLSGPSSTDKFSDKPLSWFRAAVDMGYNIDNPPPEGWVPGTPISETKQLAWEDEKRSDPTVVSSARNSASSTSVPTSASSDTTQPEQVNCSTHTSPKIWDWHVAAIAAGFTRDNLPYPGWMPTDKVAIPVKATLGRSKVGDKLRQNKLEESKDSAPHVIVVARAGTGKTWTLVEGVKKVLGLPVAGEPSPQQAEVWRYLEMSKGIAKSICFCAFGNAIAAELKSKVPPGVAAMTCHSMGFRTVQASFGKVQLEDMRVHNIIAELLGQDYRAMKAKEYDFLSSTAGLVSLCKANLVGYDKEAGEAFGVSIEDLDRIAQHYGLELEQRERSYDLVGPILKRCMDVKADNMIDFTDMIWLPIVLNLPLVKYDLLLVDEMQDLNRCQQEVALRAGHRIIGCGDDKQAIFGFAGADCESMDRMFTLLNQSASFVGKGMVEGMPSYTPAGGCVRLPLTVTRRCGKLIVEEAKKLVPDFEAFPTNPDGKIMRMRYDTPKADPSTKLELDASAPPIPENPETICYRDKVEDGDFVLCRVNAPLVSQCFRFLKSGKKATIRGRSIGDGLKDLIKKFKASDVADLILKLSDWHQEEVRKENAKRFPSEERLIAIGDKYQCLLAFCDGLKEVYEVLGKIESIFVDDAKEGVILSSIHKAKGLESKRVFFLTVKGAECPHPMANSPWQIEQEYNLKYVAITRAKEELVYVT